MESVETTETGVPCDCCALDFTSTTSGGVAVAYRNNFDNVRNQVVSIASAGSSHFDSSAQATFTDWYVTMCPTQGPTLAFANDGHGALVVADGSTGYYRTMISNSDDGGETWTGDISVFNGDGYTEPVVTIGSSGLVYVAANHDDGAVLAVSNDGGVTFGEAVKLETPHGAVYNPKLDSAGGTTVLMGMSDHQVYIRRLE